MRSRTPPFNSLQATRHAQATEKRSTMKTMAARHPALFFCRPSTIYVIAKQPPLPPKPPPCSLQTPTQDTNNENASATTFQFILRLLPSHIYYVVYLSLDRFVFEPSRLLVDDSVAFILSRHPVIRKIRAMVRVKVRVFTFLSDPRDQNSYIVGTIEGGLQPTVGTLALDDKELPTVTFAQLRPRLELRDDDGMMRRSLLFQEVLALIMTSPNPHRWSSSALQTYWFGYFAGESDTIPRAIPVTEEDAPISKYLNMTTSKLTGDLILIPQTQFGPVCEQCCQGCDQCPPIQARAATGPGLKP